MLERILTLRSEISLHNYNYYVLSEPKISDFEFDSLMKELIELEEQNPQYFDINSPTQKVGSDKKISGFEQIKHNKPMLSLSNTSSIEEVIEFMTKLNKLFGRKLSYHISLKFDGAALSIIFKNGVYYKAVTRGDGLEGDDVTENVRTIKNIPLVLNLEDVPEYLELRGEVIMLHQNFETANKLRISEGDKAFENPRNAASGTLKSYKSSNVSKIGLSFMPFKLICDDFESGKHSIDIETIYDLGFQKSPYYIVESDFDKIKSFIKGMDSIRKTLPFDIDGLVITVDDSTIAEQIGYGTKSPKFATSYKFKAERLTTQLLSIEYQVGRTGAITPVANLKPIRLAGTTVKRASMHNADQIKLHDIHENDFVLVEKGGEIIPKIVGVDISKRDINAKPIQFITHCPECGSLLYKDDNYANHFCINSNNCKPQIVGMIDHFGSKDAMKIEIGESTISKMVDKKIISNIADLYIVEKSDLLRLEGFADKSAEKLIDEINLSKKQPFQRVLYGLGIPEIGKSMSKKLIESGYTNIDLLINAKEADLIKLPEIGELTAKKIINWFLDLDNIVIIEQLREHGLNMEADAPEQKGDKLKGKSFVYSGTFPIERSELEKMITDNGGEIKSSISAKLDYLICGNNIGPAKLEKANSIPTIKQITYNDFLNLL